MDHWLQVRCVVVLPSRRTTGNMTRPGLAVDPRGMESVRVDGSGPGSAIEIGNQRGCWGEQSHLIVVRCGESQPGALHHDSPGSVTLRAGSGWAMGLGCFLSAMTMDAVGS